MKGCCKILQIAFVTILFFSCEGIVVPPAPMDTMLKPVTKEETSSVYNIELIDRFGESSPRTEKVLLNVRNGCTYKLLDNIILTSSIFVDSGYSVTIDLNGYALIGPDSDSVIKNYGILTIIDNNPKATTTFRSGGSSYVYDPDGDVALPGGAITGGYGDALVGGGGVYNAGDLFLKGGNIAGNYSESYGGGILNDGGYVSLTGGNIEGNYGKYGGAIADISNPPDEGEDSARAFSVVISGGTVSGNSASSGGGIYAHGERSFVKIEAGEILTNTANTGFAINMGDSASLFITGGVIFGTIDKEKDANISVRNGKFDTEFPEEWLVGGAVFDSGSGEVSSGTGDDSSGATVDVFHKDGSLTSGGEEMFATIEDGATYMLMSNVSLTSDITIPINYSVIIDLNGFVLSGTGNGRTVDSGIQVNAVIFNRGTLQIIDSTPSRENYYDPNLDNKGYVWNGANGSVSIFGGAITGGGRNRGTSETKGGGIYNYGGKLTVSGGVIVGNGAYHGGGIYSYSGSATIKNATIMGNVADRDGGGYYGSGSSITMENVTVSKNYASNYAGGVYLSGLKATLTGITVTENSCSKYGGGIYVQSQLEVVLTDGIVTGNRGGNGGGIYNGGNLSVVNGKVENNRSIVSSATDGGGGVYNNMGGILKLSGCSVSENIVQAGNSKQENSTGFGSEVLSLGTVEMSGATAVKSGKGSSISAMYSKSGVINISSGGVKGSMAMDREGSIVVVGGYFSEEPYLFLAPGADIVRNERGGDMFPISEYPYMISCSFVEVTSPSGEVKQETVETFNNLRHRYSYRLLSDTVLDRNIVVGEGTTITIDLNGFVLKGIDGSPVIENNGSLTINDNGSSLNNYFSKQENGAYVWSTKEADAYIAGGVICGTGTAGDAIIYNYGTLTMNGGGVACGNFAGFGGGIVNKGQTILSNVSVMGNVADDGGGIANFGTMTLTNSKVADNASLTSDGGGIYNEGTLTITGGSVENNISVKTGGGIFSKLGATVVVDGTTIGGNRASSEGGGVAIKGGSFEFISGKIEGNSAVRGGGIFVDSIANSVVIKGGTISGNNASDSGQAIYNKSTAVSVSGGGIKGSLASTVNKGISISGGYFDSDAKNSIKTAWLAEEGLAYNDNDGSKAQYPKADFPYKLGKAEPCVLITESNGRETSIINVVEFGELGKDGATYKLMKNLFLTNKLTVPTDKTVTLDLNGFVLKAAESDSVIANNGTLTLEDSNPTAVHKYTKGSNGLYTWNDTNGDITLRGGAITGGNTSGGGVYNNGTFIMQGGNIAGNTASFNGGGVNNNGTFTLQGGSITGNTASSTGGGVFNDNGTFTMTGGNIAHNTASLNGGGVHVDKSGTFTMEGGSIAGNAANSGGGVYNREGTFTMTGGNIADNAANSGGGVYTYRDGTFTMESGGIKDEIYPQDGTISIKGGYFGTEAINTIDTSWLAEGVLIGENDGSNATYPKAGFPYKVGNLSSLPPSSPSNAAVLVTESNGATTYLSIFALLNANNATYKLLKNVQLLKNLTVPANTSVTLDLNGFVLKGTGTAGVITNNGNLTLIDSNASAVHKYTKGDDGLYTWDDANGTITVKGGAITGGNVSSGGGVYVSSGTFTMKGGSIVGNTAKNGSGVYNNGTFTLQGGSIVGNTATLYGGGVCNYNATFTMEGGSIAGNTAKNNGGGVSNSYKGTFTMNSGGIKDKIHQSNSTISINGGYFGTEAKNSIETAWLAGDLVWGDNDGSDALYSTADYPHKLSVPYVSVTKDGNTEYIHDVAQFTELNTDGATYKLLRNIELTSNLTVPADKTVTLDLNGFVLKGTGSDSVITNAGNLTLIDSNPTAVHKYTKGSDGLYTWDDANGTITVKGGAITGGDSGVHNTSRGTFTMEGGCIVGNTASGSGGGVYNYGTFTMEGGSIVGNTAKSNGGGVYNNNGNGVSNGTFTMKGGNIADNTASGSGGGVDSNCTFTMEGGGIKDEIYKRYGTISIKGGYFGTEAKNSIETAWVAGDLAWGDNDGSKVQYPKADFPYKLGKAGPCVLITESNGRETSIINVVEFTELNTDGATYKLLRNVELRVKLTVPADKTVTLDLNGFVLKGTGSDKVITNSGNLTLIDSNPTAVHKYTKGSNGLYTWNDTNGDITLRGGAITGGTATYGGGVNNYYGTFTMEGGSIVGNTATVNGGGVTSDGPFTMQGGSIVGNAAKNGGGVLSCGPFTMQGGSIVDNTAADSGGGVQIYESTFIMQGGSIAGNTANYGGGVGNNTGTFTMQGGSIAGNTASGCGGGVNNNGTFTMNGGGIKGEIYRNNGTITISGGYFGTEAKNTIDTAWLGGKNFQDNSGTTEFPASEYPYVVK